MTKRGLFVVFEGVDGSGTSTQIPELIKHIESLNKYQIVLKTHEPTAHAKEILKHLKQDADPFENAEKLAKLYAQDRAQHSKEFIAPNIKKGVFVICDRHKMSTCAYQWAQGLSLDKLHKLHKNKEILIPDITFFIHVRPQTAGIRIKKRGIAPDKFEKEEFRKILIGKYQTLVSQAQENPRLFGKVIKINGNQSIKKVSLTIINFFDEFYEKWKEDNGVLF